MAEEGGIGGAYGSYEYNIKKKNNFQPE